MREESCWFCNGGVRGRVYRRPMHHPETLERVEVAAPACDACLGTLGRIERVQGVASLVVLAAGVAIAFILAPQILDAIGAGPRRGRTAWFLAWPLRIGLMVPIALIMLPINALVKTTFRRSARMERGDIDRYPGAEDWARLGYKWGEPSKRPAKAGTRGRASS